ncbi:MAG: HlyD family efflux transporter periplasmic adaptor subunit [Rikenellaceae bacterium]|nr:HlyD family efflux transporter periplasmic adaptor subunit [Rikenellaceae bacterium]
MKNSTLIAIFTACLLIVGTLLVINRHISRLAPKWIQGEIGCTTYKAASKVAGRILRIAVSEGDRVEQGELLYTLSTPELDARLSQAEAAELAASALDRKALRGARPEQRREAYNLWQKAEAGLQLATRSYERTKRLYDQGVATAQQYDEAQAQWQAAEASERMARAQYELVEAGAEKEEKEAAAARVDQAAGAVEEVLSYLRDATVFSPAGGEISTITAEVGELVSSGYPVVTILDLRDQWAEFHICENLLSKIRMGRRLEGHVPALKRAILFEVSYIAPEADFATRTATSSAEEFDVRTFLIKARPIRHEEGLRPGMSVLFDWRSF